MTTFGRDDANIHNLPVPNIEAMREHLEHLFGDYLDGLHEGLIELAWTDTRPTSDGRYALRHANLWGTDKLEELAQEACRLNTQAQCNVYIGAALRKPDTFPGGRAKDTDFLGLTCAYVDLDDPGVTEAAKGRYQEAKPTKIVVTGREPYRRAQMWWRLSEPIIDPALSEALLKGMASILSGDSSVTNPARVMRLAGSIAWPVKPDRHVVELTYIAPLKEPGAPTYAFEHLSRLFPPDHIARVDGVHIPDGDGVSRETNVLGLAGKVNDFRDLYMLRTVEAVMIQLIGETGKCPTPQELFDVAWPQYAEHADLTKPGKGVDVVAKKCVYTVRRFNEGKIGGCESLEKAKSIYRQKTARSGYRRPENPKQPVPNIDDGTVKRPIILTSKQFADSLVPPSYIIDGIIQQGFLYSLTARTGHGKTAVVMRAAAAIALGEEFADCPTRQGSVLYFAGENPQDVRARYVAMADYIGMDTDTAPFYFVDGRIDIEENLARIRAEALAIPDLRLIVVDTAAAYFQGDDGNSNAQLGRYAGLLRQLTFLPSLPTGIVNCHPVKNAASDNLLPMGGSAFVNEVDGNLTLWTDGDSKTTILHWQGKFRGPEFDPVSFDLKEVTSEKVKDQHGRLMPSVMAVHMPDNVAERRHTVNEEDENIILRLVYADKHASFSVLARRSSFTKSKVQRIIRSLKEDRLVRKFRGSKYRLTPKGCAAVGLEKEDEFDAE